MTGDGPVLREHLLGTWDLVSFVRLVDDEPIADVLGPDPVGRLTYQADGRVTALLARRDRPWRCGDTFLSVGDEVRGAAAREFVAYSGRSCAGSVRSAGTRRPRARCCRPRRAVASGR